MLLQQCLTCSLNSVGCEENCPFELQTEDYSRASILPKRKALKAEKKKAVDKAALLCKSAKKKKGQRNLYDPKSSYKTAEKNLKKQEARAEKRKIKNLA